MRYNSSVKTIVLSLLALFAAGCDPCLAALKIHHERCVDGDQASCDAASAALTEGPQSCPVGP